jgi:hypothetical protein
MRCTLFVGLILLGSCWALAVLTAADGHTPTNESNAQLYVFFEHFLRGDAKK